MKTAGTLVILLAAALAGCAAPGVQPGAGRAPTGGPEPAPGAIPASRVLLEQGRADRGAGRYDEATTAIERALRIDPNDPLLWLELGEIKLEEGDREQAEAMARKALTLAAGDRAVEARASRLIR